MSSDKFAEYGIENKYYGDPFYMQVAKAAPAAAERAAAKSGNPQTRAGKKAPNADSVARRAEASARAKGASPALTAKAAKVGERVGTVLTLALSGWEISQGASPGKVILETAAGFGLAAGAAALGVSAPVWGVVVGSAIIVYGVGKAYESWVPLRTRERIDEGIRDVWDATVGSAWETVFG